MIILDTNVLSALMRPDPDEAVREWLNVQRADEVYTTAIAVFELLAGIETLAISRKRATLEKAFAAAMAELEHRALPFDAHAAAAWRPCSWKNWLWLNVTPVHVVSVARWQLSHAVENPACA